MTLLINKKRRGPQRNLIDTSPISVAEPHHFDADPDPAFHFDADTDPDTDPACHFDVDPYPRHFLQYILFLPYVFT